MPESLLRAVYAYSHLILPAIPCGMLCYHHFREEEICSSVKKKLAQGHEASDLTSQDSNPDMSNLKIHVLNPHSVL